MSWSSNARAPAGRFTARSRSISTVLSTCPKPPGTPDCVRRAAARAASIRAVRSLACRAAVSRKISLRMVSSVVEMA